MANNLVLGGARRGKFQTRRNRIVYLDEIVDHAQPLEPGQGTPLIKKVWKGRLMMMDGTTVDTIKYWHMDGSAESMNGVSSDLDLYLKIGPDEPEPAVPTLHVAIPAPKPEPKPEPKKTAAPPAAV